MNMPPVIRSVDSTNSLHTIPEESKICDEEEGDSMILDSSQKKDERVPYKRSNSILVNAIRRTSNAIVSLTHTSSFPNDLNDDRKFSMPAVEAKRRNRRNGE